MSVLFSPNLTPIGYHLRCAFDATIYPTNTELPSSHPATGGCAQAQAWIAMAADQGWAATVAHFGTPVNEERAYEAEACTHWWGDWDRFKAAFIDHPSVQMSNSNASGILEALGIDWSGEMDAVEFSQRVLVARATNVFDEAKASSVRVGAAGATVVSNGRPAGYNEERLGQLADLAVFAHLHKVTVRWG